VQFFGDGPHGLRREPAGERGAEQPGEFACGQLSEESPGEAGEFGGELVGGEGRAQQRADELVEVERAERVFEGCLLFGVQWRAEQLEQAGELTFQRRQQRRDVGESPSVAEELPSFS
jgi:hypothetical protein